MSQSVSVLFVCIGNICRSPTAEGVFQSQVHKAGLSDKIRIDSAGMSAYHVGERADRRARECGTKRGYDLQSISRQFVQKDFSDFDYILPMDESNLPQLIAMASNENERKKIVPFIQLSKTHGHLPDVPDPYYGGSEDYEFVMDIVEEGCEVLLDKIIKEHRLA